MRNREINKLHVLFSDTKEINKAHFHVTNKGEKSGGMFYVLEMPNFDNDVLVISVTKKSTEELSEEAIATIKSISDSFGIENIEYPNKPIKKTKKQIEETYDGC
jgi:hypothetical protein